MAIRHRLLVILTLSSAVAVVDRQLIIILQEPIRRDLGLSDTQLGLLTGFAFSLFYALFGIPLGRLADRSNRRNLLSLALLTWSGFTAVTAFAATFTHLLLARVGVAVGEAAVTPASTAIISDTYPPRKLALATALYTNGFQIGLLVGFLAGGWLERAFGWRHAFLVASVPGLLLAAILRFGFGEPSRSVAPSQRMPLGEGLRHIAGTPTLRRMAPAVVLSSMAAFTLMTWSAPVLIRVHGMTLVEAGTWLALGFGVGGFFGNAVTGALADRLAARDPRWYLWLPALTSLVLVPFLAAAALAPAWAVPYALMVPFSLIVGHSGTCITLVNRIVAPMFRATAISLYLLVANILGMGLGVTLVGFLSDRLTADFGSGAINAALFAVVTLACIAAVGPYLAAARHICADLPPDPNSLSNVGR